MTSNQDSYQQDIENFADNGDVSGAVACINRYLAETPNAELHFLRVRETLKLLHISAENQEDSAKKEDSEKEDNDNKKEKTENPEATQAHITELQESLAWLLSNNEETFEKARTLCEESLTEYLKFVEKNTRSDNRFDVSKIVQHMELLAPLADYFAPINLIHGIALLYQFENRRRNPFDDLFNRLRRGQNNTPSLTVEEELQTISDKLNNVLDHIQRNDVLAIAYLWIGRVYENQRNIVKAWRSYQKSYHAEPSETLEQKITEIEPQAILEIRAQLIQRIADAISQRELEKAETLIKKLMPTIPEGSEEELSFEEMAFKRQLIVHQADIAFLRGDFDTAIQRYNDLLNGQR